MLLFTPFQQAFRSFRANKMRSVLTTLGIVIGIASVIALVSAGRGAQNQILTQVQSVGANLLIVTAGGRQEGRAGPPTSGGSLVVKTLTLDDAAALMNPENAPSVRGVAAEVRSSQKIQANGYEKTTTVTGVSPSYFTIRNTPVERGIAFTDADNQELARIAVLGPTLATDAFGETDPLGQTIRIGSLSFEVVGISKAKGASGFGGDPDSSILIPVLTAQRLVQGIDYVQTLDVEAADSSVVAAAQQEIEVLLLERHNILDAQSADFSVRNSTEMLSTLQTVTTSLTLFLAAIAAISLLVGGIGIMNIMLVAVTERTREIGLRKAVGARKRDVLTQFLVEAISLTTMGGVIGISIGLGISALIARVAGWAFLVQWDAIAIATIVSASFGVVFGMYPAAKAARLNPIDALRAE